MSGKELNIQICDRNSILNPNVSEHLFSHHSSLAILIKQKLKIFVRLESNVDFILEF